jgi:hypothetical protein
MFLRKILQMLDGSSSNQTTNTANTELKNTSTYQTQQVKYTYDTDEDEDDGDDNDSNQSGESSDTHSSMPGLENTNTNTTNTTTTMTNVICQFMNGNKLITIREVDISQVPPSTPEDEEFIKQYLIDNGIIINNNQNITLLANNISEAPVTILPDGTVDTDISISGTKFNEIYNCPTVKMVKLTNEYSVHNNFEFKEGLNEDINMLDYTQVCGPDGLYFCSYDDMTNWLSYSDSPMKYVWDVQIPDDARVVVYRTKLKTNKFILSNRRELTNEIMNQTLSKIGSGMSVTNAVRTVANYPESVLSDELFLKLVQMDASVIAHIPLRYKTYDVCLESAKHYKNAYEHIVDVSMSYEIMTHCVRLNPLIIKKIEEKNMSEELYRIAFENNPSVYRWIPERFRKPDMISKVIQSDINSYRTLLEFIPVDQLNETFYMEFVKMNCNALEIVPFRYKSQEMVNEALNCSLPDCNILHHIPLKFITKKICIDLVLKNSAAFYNKTIPDIYLDFDFYRSLVNKYPGMIKYVAESKDNKLNNFDNIISLIKINPDCYNYVSYVIDKSENDCIIDLVKSGVHFKHLKTNSITLDLLHDLVSTRPSIINEISHQFLSDDLYMICLNKGSLTFDQIPDEFRTSELCKLQIKLNPNDTTI